MVSPTEHAEPAWDEPWDERSYSRPHAFSPSPPWLHRATPSGHFRAVVYIGTDPLTGGRHNLTETVDDYDEAERALTRLLNQVDENRHPKWLFAVEQFGAAFGAHRGARRLVRLLVAGPAGWGGCW